LRNNKHHSIYLQRAYNLYGEEAFDFIILERVEDSSILISREQWWIDNGNSEYNICRIAGSSLGVKRRKESREKMKLAHLGEVHSKERRYTKSISQGGKNHYNYGKKLSGKTKAKKSKSMINYFKNNDHWNNKPVYKLDLEGNILEEYKSISEAGNNETRMKKAINNCLLGKSKTSYGFKWKYKNE
jgi:group I intron endonuclease